MPGSEPSRPRADVCVVGSGPAGLAVAVELGRAGRSVVLLESGPGCSSPRAQELNEGEHRGEPYRGLRQTRHRQVGGTPNVWNVEGPGGGRAAKYVPLSERDMAAWPIDRGDLERHYRQAQRLCGLGPFEYGAKSWASEARRPFELEGTGLESGVYHFGPADRFTRHLPDRLRRMESVTLVPSATVVEVRPGPSSRGVRAVRADGDEMEVEARRVVLACGAVENARLLLRTGPGGQGGLPWLGRGFMEHGRDFSLELVPSAPAVFREASFYDAFVHEDGGRVGGRLAPTDATLDAHDLPSASVTLIPRARGRRSLPERALRAAHRVVFGGREGRYGWSRVPAPERAFDVFDLVVNLEHGPRFENRIELTDRCDRFGNPLPRLVLEWSEREQVRLERLRVLLRDWFRSAGLGELGVSRGHRPDLSAHHHAGTTRMAGDRRDGVVNPDCRVYGVDGLYAAGGSVFPTAGFANPTLTIVALSLRLAEHLDTSLR